MKEREVLWPYCIGYILFLCIMVPVGAGAALLALKGLGMFFRWIGSELP